MTNDTHNTHDAHNTHGAHDTNGTSPVDHPEPSAGTPRPETPLPEILRYSSFTHDPAGGNPAGVVLDASGLDDVTMLAIAAEVGYSETAFVTAADETARRFRVRYFSPLAEVAFCGHATVALAVALAERLGPGGILLDTLAGEIPVATTVDVAGGTARATLTSVPTRSRPTTAPELDAALKALGWSPDDLDPALPPHVAFGGNDHLVLAAGSRARLADLDYDFDGLAEVMRRHDWTTVHLVWRESPEHFHARDPFPVGGVVEDPATGAAAAAFGGYLRTLGLVTAPVTVTIRQGEDMGRPSDLRIDVSPEDPRTRVTGQAVPID
ncbi:PhzF family phenazine biosynthesis isomerase [Streptomyces europaeiscabiei]|uniref:PhzF family phenazine biosynthesis isomerase n=1 Tax=Streptomyces europaeiscabiei TaxID=146819 RepID=UPI0029A51428|nr:PhzF family phenazine biosynthesis isomerase [Streptomyces europaeiscabiei]MDX3690248.1 PhzF family phenazine biosynthesis isomerase [Streptomyces europaeiscabiei]